MNNKSLTCQPHLAFHEMLDTRYGFEIFSTLVEKSLQIHPKNAKQSQFFPFFHLKMKILQKNKANSNPIRTQNKTCPRLVLTCFSVGEPILTQKSGGQTQFKPNLSSYLTSKDHLFTFPWKYNHVCNYNLLSAKRRINE